MAWLEMVWTGEAMISETLMPASRPAATTLLLMSLSVTIPLISPFAPVRSREPIILSDMMVAASLTVISSGAWNSRPLAISPTWALNR